MHIQWAERSLILLLFAMAFAVGGGIEKPRPTAKHFAGMTGGAGKHGVLFHGMLFL